MNITPPVAEFKKHSHCGYCGAKFLEQNKWPRKCFVCYNESYSNPIPCVGVLIPIIIPEYSSSIGLLIQQRNIEPKKGEWALPGGYMNGGETWQETASRECEEEMHVYTKPETYNLIDIRPSTTNPENMLIFCNNKKIWQDRVKEFIGCFLPNEEVLKLDIYYGEAEPNYTSHEIAFPTHKELANIFLAQINSGASWSR